MVVVVVVVVVKQALFSIRRALELLKTHLDRQFG